MVSQIKVNEIIKQSGSSISIGESGDTINLAGSAYAAAGVNTPAFAVSKSSAQALTNNTTTKITFDTEYLDTANAFASNKFTCPSGQAGNYIMKMSLLFYKNAGNYIKATELAPYKNGGPISYGNDLAPTNFSRISDRILVDFLVELILEF